MTQPQGPKPLVIQTEDLDPAAVAWLNERARVERVAFTDYSVLNRLLPEAAGVVVRTYTKVDRAFLEQAKNLRVVARAGVGLDNIDLPECRRRGVAVVSTPDANGSAVSELVFAFILDALRPRAFLDQAVPPDRWASIRKELTARRQIEGLTFGILGMGKVGTRIARIATGFGARVLFHDLLDIDPEKASGGKPASLDEILTAADIFTIHVDGRPENRGLLRAEHFSRLKSDVVFINTSRGLVLDHGALAAFLASHPAATAMLDVHDPEPITAENPLLGLPNAHLTPHLGAATAQAHANMSWVVNDLWRVLSGEVPRFPA